MKNHRHPWNLRQIFGSQPVGCVAGSPRPEARIAARVIPAESSRWTFRGPSDADLATWRLGDLATWRLGRGRPSGCPLTRSPLTVVQAFPQSSTPKLGISLQVDHPDHASPPKAQQLFERLLRYHRSAQSSSASFSLEIARNQELSGCHRSVRFSIFDNLFIVKIQLKIQMGLNI